MERGQNLGSLPAQNRTPHCSLQLERELSSLFPCGQTRGRGWGSCAHPETEAWLPYVGAASVSQGSRNFSEPHCIPLHGPLIPWSTVDVLPLSRQLASSAAQPTPLETASPFSSPGGARQLSRNPERAAQVLRSHLRHFIEEKQGGEGALRGSPGPQDMLLNFYTSVILPKCGPAWQSPSPLLQVQQDHPKGLWCGQGHRPPEGRGGAWIVPSLCPSRSPTTLGPQLRLCAKSLSRVCLSVTLWTVAYQAPLSMGFSRQEYCSRLPCPPAGTLPNPGTEPTSPVSPALQADSLLLSHQGRPKDDNT